MNGPLKMYRATQIVRHDFPVELPTCMYKLKNIHSSRTDVLVNTRDHVSPPTKKLDIFDQNNQQPPEMAELEARQEKILQQLEELKKQIFSIKKDLKITNQVTPNKTSVQTASCKKLVDHPEIVINASPTNPPYSLEIVQKLLQNDLGLVVTSYLHSSVSSLSDESKNLQNSLTSFRPPNGVPQINIRLIWKNIDSKTEFLVSQTPIAGEVNLLRYFTRVTDNKLSFHEDPDSVEINYLLDLCYLLIRAKTKTERTGILQSFNKSLGKGQFLNGRSHCTVADVAAYSAIKQCGISNEISANLTKWFQRCAILV